MPIPPPCRSSAPYGPFRVNTLDQCSRVGAGRLARVIEARWAAVGCAVACSVVAGGVVQASTGRHVYFVRSNLINGLPPKAPE